MTGPPASARAARRNRRRTGATPGGEGGGAGRSEALLAAALAAGVFTVFAAGACRTIYVGDSGELVTAVHLLGIPHPSGYPLYVLLGKLWTLLVPAGSIAFRMSLFSAACGAAACGLLYMLCRRIGLHRAAACAAALMLAFAPSFWAEANVQRVYTLNALFVVAVTAVAWRWRCSGRWGDLALAFFLCGLGASNHTFMALMAAALGLYALASRPSLLLAPARLAAAGAAFLPGLLPYIYLPLRSRADPRLDWGNPETLEGFLTVVGRGDFWQRAWIEGPADLFPIAADYLRGLGEETAWAGAALALIGIAAGLAGLRGRPAPPPSPSAAALSASPATGFQGGVEIVAGDPENGGPASKSPSSGRAGRPASASTGPEARQQGPGADARNNLSATLGGFVLFPVLVMAVNLLALALHGSRSDIFIWHRYYIPSYVMAALLAGLGADALMRRARKRRSRTGAAAAAGLALLVPAVLLASGWRAHDRSRYSVGESFSKLVLDSLPPGAHLIAEDDNILFTLMYLHLVEGMRPDVDLILQGVGGADLPPLRFEPRSDPLYFTHHPNWSLPGLQSVPLGVVFRAWRTGEPPPPAPPLPARLEGEDDPRVPKDYLTGNLIGHFHYMLGVTHENGDWPRARAEFDLAARASPRNDVLFFNLGLIYQRNGLLDEAAAAFARSHEINPRHLASRDRPRASDKIAAIEAELARLAAIESVLADDPALHALPARSAAWHLRMADVLEARGEAVAARGHRLLASEGDATER